MPTKFPVLNANTRTLIGRKVKQLRRQGILPANIFGNKIKSITIQVAEKDFVKLYDQVGETGLIDIRVGESSYPCLVAGFSTDPVARKYLHIDFHNVSLKEKVTASIPVELIGESPAVKDAGGLISHSMHEIGVEALPTHLPEKITIDLSQLVNIGDAISIKDLKLGADVELTADPEQTIVSITHATVAEVEAPAEETPQEAKVIGESKDETEPAKE